MTRDCLDVCYVSAATWILCREKLRRNNTKGNYELKDSRSGFADNNCKKCHVQVISNLTTSK